MDHPSSPLKFLNIGFNTKKLSTDVTGTEPQSCTRDYGKIVVNIMRLFFVPVSDNPIVM